MAILSTLFCFALLSLQCSASPFLHRHRQGRALNLRVDSSDNLQSVMPSVNFPDPTVIQGRDGTWYAFATNGNGKKVQVATAQDPLRSWTLLDTDALADKAWSAGADTWAPDVRDLGPGRGYILYWTGLVPNSGGKHCIGVARSNNIAGPYTPDAEPWVCPTDQGGAIDASSYEEGGRRYVVYKVDGNSLPQYQPCGTGADDPNLHTPIMLQRVGADGSTKIGDPVQILDRVAAEDGALVEGPSLAKVGNHYVLFFSSHCFQDPLYDIKYAYSNNIAGPYTRPGNPLLRAPDLGLDAPGGPTSARDDEGNFLVFHANCGNSNRCLYSVRYSQ